MNAFESSVLTDPLFAAEGMDLENAARALESIEKHLPTVERLYGTTLSRRLFMARYPLGHHAIPLKWIRAFIACESRRRAYLQDPSPGAAEGLLTAWETAAQEFTTAVKRYRHLHTMLVRIESSEDRFAMRDMFGHVYSYKRINAFLDQLSRNAEQLSNAVRERRALLKDPHDATQKPFIPHTQHTNLAAGHITEWQQSIHQAAIDGGAMPFRQSTILEKHGPFVYTLDNFDQVPTEHSFLMYILKDREDGYRSMWLHLCDRVYFFVFGVTPPDDGITRGSYNAHVGITLEEAPYWYIQPTYLYDTRDLQYWMDIATRIDLARRPELNRANVLAQQSSLFDLALGTTAVDIRSMVGHLARRQQSQKALRYSALYDLTTRTFPALFFLPFNHSVWRIEPAVLSSDSYVGPDQNRYLPEPEIRALSPEVLQSIMRGQKTREERGRSEGWLP